MDEQDVQLRFAALVERNPDACSAFAAIEVLLDCLRRDASETLAGLMANMKRLTAVLETTEHSNASVSSGLELFLRFITLASLEKPELRDSQSVMVDRGQQFLQRHAGSRHQVGVHAEPFIVDQMTILTHSRSRAVRDALVRAKQHGKKFHVLVTESQPDCSGRQLAEELRAADVSCSVILDAAVACVMETVDCVMVGAEGVVENGGIINKIGTYSLALSAHSFHKPLYVLAESVKFMRLYPLSQNEVPDRFKFASGARAENSHALVDYTPPRFVRLLFTDLGILTPAAVSDELIQLYM